MPTLASLQPGNTPAERAQAFLRVALSGPAEERPAAALLWGLSACEANAPTSAVTAFSLAGPRGGAALLAASRLEAALERTATSAALWRRASESPWLPEGVAVRLLVKGAETVLRQGETDDALGLLPAKETLPETEGWRWWKVRAQATSREREKACRAVVAEAPELFAEVCPGESLTDWTRDLSAGEWVVHGQAWLRAKRPWEALQAAGRAGRDGALLGARAALALRRPEEALVFLASTASAEAQLLRAEAYRQQAWRGSEGERQRIFPRVIAAADAALRTVGLEEPLAAQARLLQAEAFFELGRFQRGLSLLADSEVSLPRWEWVRRRGFFLSRSDPALGTARKEILTTGTRRGQRLATYWLGREAARKGDRETLQQLASSGFPDLPALWAARELGVAGVAVPMEAEGPTKAEPPAWALPLLAWGRVADVVVGWRAELERLPRNSPEWVGWVELAAPPPADAIPLLLRGEPRLLAGPWRGLARPLLARYLPLLWREELEKASAAAGVPPWVLAAVVRQESAWNPQARSPAGAIGLAQLMPATAWEVIRFRRYPQHWRRQLTDPAVNLALGARLLADWRSRFQGSWTAALACYNGGERRVRAAWERAGGQDGPEFVEGIEIPETWDYVHRVVLFAEGYRLLYWPEGDTYPWTSSK